MTPEPNPNADDYIITYQREWKEQDKRYCLKLRYIPDRVILPQSDLAEYFSSLTMPVNEASMAEILHLLNNLLVPRFIHLAWQSARENETFTITMEDRQPDWDNQAILSRMEKF